MAKRLSVYVGGGLGFNRHFAHSKTEVVTNVDNRLNSIVTETRNGLLDSGGQNFAHRGSWSFDAAVFTGLDFYVYKGLYIGTELGLRLTTTKEGKGKGTISSTRQGETTVKAIKDGLPSIGNTAFGFYIEPTLRLGWMF